MKKILLLATATLSAAFLMTACGKDEVSFDTLELARATVKSNGEYNANAFRAASTQYSNYALETQGDSTQKPDCPQGDGWVSNKLVDKTNPAVKVALKCSAVSGSIGCMLESEFAKKPYATDDGQCQPVSKVPFPISKIAK